MIKRKLLELIAYEFISIMENLESTEDIEESRIVITKEYFNNLLGKYDYITIQEKRRIYKDLNFIIHDKGNYTMPHRDKETGKIIRKVILNYETYNTIKKLYTKEFNV